MPQTVFDIGDTITSRLDLGVTPDGTTVVTVAVTKPDGTAQALSGGPTGPTDVDQWTCQWVAAAAGDYLAVWTVTGTGAGVTPKVFNVRPLPSASNARPVWAPFLSDVADYVPRLTVDTTTPGTALEYGTFTGTTTPTDEQAARLVDAAVTTTSAAVGVVAASLYDLATVVAALRAAAAIQRAYPRDPDDLNTAAALDARADKELARLITANADTGASPVPALTGPAHSFPEPVAWGDWLL